MPMKVRDLMTTSNPETVHPTDMLAVAEEKMRPGRLRRVPVADEAISKHIGDLPTTRVTAARNRQQVT